MVSNLPSGSPPDLPESSIMTLLEVYGTVVSLKTKVRHVGRDRTPVRWGWVQFSTFDEATRCKAELQDFGAVEFSLQEEQRPNSTVKWFVAPIGRGTLTLEALRHVARHFEGV